MGTPSHMLPVELQARELFQMHILGSTPVIPRFDNCAKYFQLEISNHGVAPV